MNYLKKLSVKTVYGKPEFEKDAKDGAEFSVMQVFGQAQGVKAGTSNFGDWEALTGNFEAVNLDTGEAYRGAQLFLPTLAHEPLVMAMKANPDTPIDFAIEVTAKKDSSVAVGYCYGMKTLIETETADPLKALREKAALQLAAPKDEVTSKPGKK